MISVQKSQTINAPKQTVWNVLKDIKNVDKFHPAISSSSLLSEQNEGVGAARQCNFYDGTHIQETVTAWHEGSAVAFEISEMSMPVTELYGRFRITPISNNETKVEFIVHLTAKFGALGWLMAQLMIKPMIKRVLSQALSGLQAHIATGASIGKNGELLQA